MSIGSPIKKKPYEIIGSGSQSIVLEKNHHRVFIVTGMQVSQRIALLHKKLSASTPLSIAIPIPVAQNIDLGSLVNPDHPANGMKTIKQHIPTLYRTLQKENTVYELPRYAGTLENLKTIRFKAPSIQVLEKTLHAALRLLHQHNLTHNDLSLKNIFYSGVFPDLAFHLGDFGSLTENSNPKKHAKKCSADFRRLNKIIADATSILKDKYTPLPYSDYSTQFMPNFENKRREKLGISPIKAPAVPIKAHKNKSHVHKKLII